MKRILVTLSAAALLLFASVGAAQAAGPKKDIATPSRSCAILVQYGAGGYSSFRDCMANINRDVAALRFPDDATGVLIGLDQRCTQLEDGLYDPVAHMFFAISYPFFFGEPPGFPIPQLTAHNHHQCEITLFTYHYFFGT